MAGHVIQVVKKQSFTVGFVTGLGGSPSAFSVLGAQTYDVSDAVSGVLLVRVASLGTVPTGASIAVAVFDAALMPDDPGTLYTMPAGTGIIASVGIPGTVTSFPSLFTAGFTISTSPSCSGQAYVALIGLPGSVAGATDVVLGVDLLIRDT